MPRLRLINTVEWGGTKREEEKGGIRQWQKQGSIANSIDPMRYAQVSWSTLHGMSRLLIDGIYVDNQARNAMCSATAEMFWRELTVR